MVSGKYCQWLITTQILFWYREANSNISSSLITRSIGSSRAPLLLLSNFKAPLVKERMGLVFTMKWSKNMRTALKKDNSLICVAPVA